MSEGPNVLVVLADGHAARFTGPDAEAGVETPAIDGLRDRGVAFTNAYAPAASTVPSRASLLTGRTVPNTAVWGSEYALPADVPTLASTLGPAGYDTCAVGSLGLAGQRQFAGFDRRPYGDFAGTGGAQFDPLTDPTARGSPAAADFSRVGGEWGHRYDPLDRGRTCPDPWRSLTGDAGETDIPESRRQERIVATEAGAFLRERSRSDDPFLLLASFAAPAPPLTAPERHLPDSELATAADLPTVSRGDADTADHPLVTAKREADRTSELRDRPTVDLDDDEVTRRARAAYAAKASYLDETVGDLLGVLDRVDEREDTIVVYASTGGCLAGEHGLWWGGTWHDAATRVPLIVDAPDGRPGSSVATPVSLIDLVPTICDAAEVDAPACDGTPLTRALRDGVVPDRGPVAIDGFDPALPGESAFRAVRDGDEKRVAFEGDIPDLRFDLSADPHEVTNVADGVQDVGIDVGVAAQRARTADHASPTGAPSGTTGNGYQLNDLRVIDADATLYYDHELARSAPAVFVDHPFWREEED